MSVTNEYPEWHKIETAQESSRLIDASRYPAVTVFGVYHRPPIKPPEVRTKTARKGDVCVACAARGMCQRRVMAGEPPLCEAATEAEVETGMLLQEIGP